MNELIPASGMRRHMAWCMAGVAVLLVLTAAGYRILHPDLLTPLPPPQERAAQPSDNRAMAGVAELMRRVQANPKDVDALTSLAEHFLHLEDWAATEQFARRAAEAAPETLKPHYLLSVALHGLGRNADAAASLERAIRIKDEPALRYSLGILYAYYLDDKTKAAEHMRLGLADPSVSGQLKADLAEELAKLGR